MSKPYLNDPRIRRILKEFRQNKPIFETFKTLCEKMGNEFMEYREFEFWFLRFSSGNFDLAYDFSLGLKAPIFTELPIDVIQKIADELGKEYRITLRHVCKPLRQLVDNWNPKLNRIDVFVVPGPVRVAFDTEIYDYTQSPAKLTTVDGPAGVYKMDGYSRDVVIDDLVSVLKHPKLELKYFEYRQCWRQGFMKYLEVQLGKFNVRIKTEAVGLKCDNLWEEIRILRFFQPTGLYIDLKNTGAPLTKMQMEKLVSEMNQTEACMKAENLCINVTEKDSKFSILSQLKCPRVSVKCEKMKTNGAVNLSKLLLKSDTLELYEIATNELNVAAIKKEFIDYGAEVASQESPNHLIYRKRYFDGNEHFEIKLDENNIKIERKRSQE